MTPSENFDAVWNMTTRSDEAKVTTTQVSNQTAMHKVLLKSFKSITIGHKLTIKVNPTAIWRFCEYAQNNGSCKIPVS